METAVQPTSVRIGRYEVLRSISKGGMAEVFLARAVGPGGIAKQVCIKRPLPANSSDPRSIQRFMQEARTVLALQHANVVPVFDFGRDENGPYLVMEWIDGCDLAALLAALRHRGQSLSPLLAAHIAAEICKALSYAHLRVDAAGRPGGILHRDVTPRNILLSRQGEVRLTDFGIASAITTPGHPAGTPAYMAPEAARGDAADARSDLYALGLVFAEMLAGQRLRGGDADTGRLETALVPVAIPSLPGIPAEIAAVVQRLLAFAPTDRYATAADTQAALVGPLAQEALLGGAPLTVRLAETVNAVADSPAGSEELPEFFTEAGVTIATLSAEPPTLPIGIPALAAAHAGADVTGTPPGVATTDVVGVATKTVREPTDIVGAALLLTRAPRRKAATVLGAVALVALALGATSVVQRRLANGDGARRQNAAGQAPTGQVPGGQASTGRVPGGPSGVRADFDRGSADPSTPSGVDQNKPAQSPSRGAPPAELAAVVAKKIRPVRLQIRAPGSWVAVYVDGQKLGNDVGEFEIRPGRHLLRVENAPLHFVREQTITARPGETLTFDFQPAP